MLPLVFLAFLHLLLGGGWLWLAWIPALLCLLAAIEIVHRQRTAAAARRAADAGRHLWRASMPIASLAGLTPVPVLVRLTRDLVPLDVEIVDRTLLMSPPHRYRRLGLGSGSIPVAHLRHIERHPLGHLRPDGSISSSEVTAVTLTLHTGYAFDLVFDYGADDFLHALGHWVRS